MPQPFPNAFNFRSRPAPQPVQGRSGRHWLPGEQHTGQIPAEKIAEALREPTQMLDRTRVLRRPEAAVPQATAPEVAPASDVPDLPWPPMPVAPVRFKAATVSVPRPVVPPAHQQVAVPLPEREVSTARLVGASRRLITRLKLAANTGRWGRP